MIEQKKMTRPNSGAHMSASDEPRKVGERFSS